MDMPSPVCEIGFAFDFIFETPKSGENPSKSRTMRASAKQCAENNRGVSGQMFTVHQRLYHALSLGVRQNDGIGKRWHSTDIEIQRLVVRSIDAFLDHISPETSDHPLVKDSVSDMVCALESILQLKSEAILLLAANVVRKMLKRLPKLQSHMLDLVHPLSSLLTSRRVPVACCCATSLSVILSSLSFKNEKKVCGILKETSAVVRVVNGLQEFFSESKPTEYFQEMASLLSKILWRWPCSRFCVWNDPKLMEVLEYMSLNPDFLAKVELLQLYSALALCGNAALRLLENGDTLLHMMVHCMSGSNSHSIRIEGFKLAQCLAINEQGCQKMMKMCCEPVVKATICGMSCLSSHSGKVEKDNLSLLTEACRLALITRWAGEHHKIFWKLKVHCTLVNLLINNFDEFQQSQPFSSLQEQIVIAKKGLNADILPALRPYVWDILGWLAAHCEEDFNPEVYGSEPCIKILMICACLGFVDSMCNSHQLHQHEISDASRSEPASRSVLMMIYSPSNYIASHVRSILDELLQLKVKGKEFIKFSLDSLNMRSSGYKFRVFDDLQTLIHLMSLASCSGLPRYRRHVIECQGIKTLLAFVRWCLSNHIHLRRLSVAPHLHDTFHERNCCRLSTEDWEDENMLLLICLMGLAELIHHSGCIESHQDIFSGQMDCSETQIMSEFQDICSDISTPGSKLYAAYILSYFGLYGFPSKFGKRIGGALGEREHSDLELIHSNGDSFSVHSVILMVRCPVLLPPKELPCKDKKLYGIFRRDDLKNCGKLRKEIRLSARVDHQILSKVLEFVYFGYLKAGADLVKKLKTYAKHCNLESLLQMLCQRHPKWGTPIPKFDLTLAFGQAGHNFSDIVLEAQADEVMHWTCNFCSHRVPHLHAHKVILWSSCDYLRALFRSGMQESHSNSMKVPVGWKALVKLVNWFYSDELPKPITGCLWDNLDSEEKFRELQPYVELCWLAEFWLLGDVHKEWSEMVVSYLDSARHLSVKIIQIAADLCQWKLAQVAADHLAPSYHHLRNSGELEELDEDLIDMIRAASVRLSQDTAYLSS